MPGILQLRAAQRLLKRELPLIGGLITGAWQDYLAYPAGVRMQHSPRSRASCVHDHMVTRARALFEPRPEMATCQDRGGLFLVLLHGRIALRFKKLDEDLRSCNIPTQQSLEFVRQEMDLPGFKRITYLQAGYQLNKTQTEISGAYIACPNGYRNLWVIDLPLHAEGADVHTIPAPSSPNRPRLIAKAPTQPKTEDGRGG